MSPEVIAIIGSVAGLLGFILVMFQFVLRTIENFHLKKDALQDELVALNRQMMELKIQVARLENNIVILTHERDLWRKRALNLLKAYKRLKNEKP